MKKSVMLAICVAGLSVTSSTSAFADQAVSDDSECTMDSDCESGWSCEEVGAAETCASTTGGEPECETQLFLACVPPLPPTCDPAQSSSDCGGDDVCVTFTYESCTSTGGGSVEPSEGGGSTGSGGDEEPPRCDTGAPGEDNGDRCGGGDPPAESCDEQIESYCVPPYIAPCSADADCGAGFTCEDVVECEPCALDTPAPGEPGGGDDEGGSCDDSCAPTGQKYCEIIEVECTSDADCGAGFECELNDAPIACAVEPGGGDEDCVGDEPAETSGYCAPEGWGYWGGGYDEGGGTSGGAPNGPGGQGWDLSDAEAARAGDASSSQDDDSDGSTSGCATARNAAPAGGGLGLLAMLLGLVGVRTRRRG